MTAYRFLVIALTFTLGLVPSNANEREWITSTTLIGPSKYADNFMHFDYVNPNAPKGGTLRLSTRGTFDSFNPFIVKGTPAAGFTYQGGILWQTLSEKGLDEPSSSHPGISEAFTFPADFSSATYRLDADAKWHDGKPITVEDVKWSLETAKEHFPQYRQYFANIKELRIDNDREVTFLFDQKGNRELPLVAGDLVILPKHWWEAKDSEGKQRDITRSTLEPPLGSGPYRIEKFSPGSTITWKRVENWWAAEKPVNVGRYNYDRLKYTYFKDGNALWEAFKKGGFSDYRKENTSRRWATEYVFPAAKNGQVRKIEFPFTSSYLIQMIYMNTRKPKFQDVRLRKALIWAMNFERMNEDLFFSLYKRGASYFGGTELSPTGPPKPDEIAALERYRGKIPDEVFTDTYELPVFKTRRDERKHLRTALNWLKEAGYEQKNGKLVSKKTGEQLTIEFMTASSSIERILKPWMDNVRKLGIDINLRVVDPAQYVARVGDYDFDMVMLLSQQSVSLGNEQREYWSSKAASSPGTRNYAGISDPSVDDLVERLIFAKDREELVTLSRALERVLQFGYYSVPTWYSDKERFAFWDKIVLPEKQPEYTGYDPFSWWIDTAKEPAQENAQ